MLARATLLLLAGRSPWPRWLSVRVYPALMIAVLAAASLETIQARPGPPFGPIILALFGLDLILADRLARHGRAGTAAAVVVLMLLSVALVGGLLYPARAASAFAPLIAFAVMLPHLSGGRVRAAAILAPIAAAALALVTAGPRALAEPALHGDVALGAGGATAILVLILLRQRRDNAGLVRRHSAFLNDLRLGVFRTTGEGRIVDANDTCVRLLGYPDRATLLKVAAVDLYVDPSVRAARETATDTERLLIGETQFRRYDGTLVWLRHRTRLLTAHDGSTALEGVIEDIADERVAHEMADRLAALVESADDAIIGCRLDGTVTAWNPASESMYGWTGAEMIGQPVTRIVPSSRRAEFLGILDQVRAGGRIRSLETEQIAGDGRTLVVSLTVSPVHDREGRVVGIAAVSRDITEQRRLQSQLERWTSERALIVEALHNLTPGPSLEATALAICREICTTGGFAHAGIVAFHDEDRFSTLAVWAAGRHIELPELMVPLAASGLLERAREGSWIGDVDHSPWPAQHGLMHELGVQDLAYVPIEFSGRLVGLLVAGTGSLDPTVLVERLPALVQFAAISAPILGRELDGHRNAAASRGQMLDTIATRAFTSVFQPVVELATRTVLGYEALTRFASGIAPNRVLAEARAQGLGLELEAATLETALTSSGLLPANAFLDLNVSPAMILAVEPLRSILARWGWGVVLEITEHEAVDDYAALRSALGQLGPNVRLAIDDAGAGFASLKHILELRPTYVKLDRALVAGIDGDKARQGLVAGMRHFAESIDCQLVAEGVETEEEREMLLALDVRLGQGYIFGRPRPAA